MAEQNPIRYSDLISPDDSIEKLIGQLEQLNESYTGMANSVKSQAQQVALSLKAVSGATEEGRKKIKESNDEAMRLERAYRQLDAALSANAKEIARLNAVKREANNYNKQMVLRGKEEIKTMQQIKEASYQQLSAQYSLNKAYINSLSATDRRIAKNKELIKSTKEIYEQMKRLQADTGKMQLNVGNYPLLGGLANGLGGKALGLGGVAAAGMALAGVIKDNVSLATEYEKSLSVLAAILNTTKDGVKDLSEQAQHLGATTAFTAKEVVELQTELAKLGYTTEQIQNMAPAILDFSMATGSSLADAASLAGAALRMFEKDTTHTTEFVDKMSAATTKSALNFGYLQNAMSTVAPVANAFGFKIEDVLALLGQLANAGFDASSAATATRNILLNLADANGKLAKALGEPVKDLDGLINGLQKLDEKGIDLGETLELTDKRSVAAFNTFLSGADNVRTLRDELATCDGWAHKMADTMSDNMAGSLKTLSSAWEGFNLHINQSNGLLKTLVDWLTKAVRWIDKLVMSLDRYIGLDTSKDGILNRMADKYDDGTYDDNGNIIKTATTTTDAGGTGGGGTKTTNLTKKQLKAQQAAAKAALRAQEKQEKESLTLRRKFEDLTLDLIEDEQVRERAKIIQSYDRQKEDLQKKLDDDKKKHTLSAEDRKVINDSIVAIEQAKQTKLAALWDKQLKKEQEAEDKAKKKQQQASEQKMREQEKAIDLENRIRLEEIDQLTASEKEKTRLRLEAEKERLMKLMALYQQDGKKLADKEIQLIKTQIDGVDKELKKNKAGLNLYDMLGFNLTDDQKAGITSSFSFAIGQLNDYLNAWVQAADAKAQLAEKEVERAQNVLQAEMEARNAGYASDVETARKELELAKKNQEQALKEREKAQKAQLLMDSISQASNLISASALIWSQFGFPWAIPALAVMWGSFAASKIKAAELTKAQNETYGEGTVELLDGGSHQSGNDVDLGRKKDGTRRRAEGGEFFAVINKRNSRRFRSIIPDVVHSLNDGTFADKYMNAYGGGAVMVNMQQKDSDLRRLSDDVHSIREQGESRSYTDERGTHVVYKNLHRIYKN